MTTHTRNMWIDANQGTRADGRAFGFIGLLGTDDYQGLFFSWPDAVSSASSPQEIEAVVDSLEYDETCPCGPPIDYDEAAKALRRFLKGGL